MPEKPFDFPTADPEPSAEQHVDQLELPALKNKAAELLRRDHERGEVSAEAQDALMAWRLAAEKSAVASNAQESRGIIQVRVTMEQSAILRDGGWYQEAFDALYDAQTHARAENRRDLFESAGNMMDEINKLE